MNAGRLDTITGNFVTALLTATAALSSQYSLGLLAIFASITFYLHMGQLTMAGSLVTGDVLASFVLVLVKIGTFFWLLKFLPHIGTAAFQTFLQWGMAASGNTVVAQRFNSPPSSWIWALRPPSPSSSLSTISRGQGICSIFSP